MPRKPKPPDPPKPKRRAPNSGSVFTRADGRIGAILPISLDPKRRPHYGPGKRLRFASEAAAAAWLSAEIARLTAPVTQAASHSEPLGAYLARWYANNREEWPERTARAYSLSLRRWRVIGGVPLGSLTREVVQGGVAQLQRQTWQWTKKDGTPTSEPKHYSRRTIQQARTLLYQALEDLVPDVLAYNPARSRRRSRKDADPEQPVWSADQADRFLATADKLDEYGEALAFRLILRRALRIGEVVALTHADVNERAGVIRIDETAGMRRGTSGPTKTRRVRDVPLSADLVARLREHRRKHPSTDPHLFTVRGERISLSYLRLLWHRTIRVARLPTITPKDGRATCATILLDEGWALPRVAQLLGHASVATTSAFYARTLKRRDDQIARIGEDIDATFRTAADRDAEGAPAELRAADGTE